MTVLLGIIAVFIILPPGNDLSRMQIEQVTSSVNIKAILSLIASYRKEHSNQTPSSLTGLIPYADDDLEMFYLPKSRFQQPNGRIDITRLDEISAYELVQGGQSNIVVREKLGLWGDGTIAIGLSDGTVERLSSEEFQKLHLR